MWSPYTSETTLQCGTKHKRSLNIHTTLKYGLQAMETALQCGKNKKQSKYLPSQIFTKILFKTSIKFNINLDKVLNNPKYI